MLKGLVSDAPGTSTVLTRPRVRRKPWNVPPSIVKTPTTDTSCRSIALLKTFVRIDQILLAGGLLAVGGDLLEPQRPGERDFLRVRARERGLDLGGDPLAQLLGGLEADPL